MWQALQTVDLMVDGQEIKLRKGESVAVDELTGTALASGGFVARVEDEAPVYDSGDSGLADEAPGYQEKH